MRMQELSCDIGNGADLRFPQNTNVDIDWIRKQLTKPGKSQAGLARALGINPSGVNRLLSGDRELKAREIEKVRGYLGAKLSTGFGRGTLPQGDNTSNDAPSEVLEIRGMAEGGPDGWNLWNGEVVQFITRPDNLRGVPGAYGVYVTGHSMEPRYTPGDTVHIHPGKPTPPGAYVLVQRKAKAAGEPPLAVIKQLVRRSGSKVTLAQLNPKKEFDVAAGDIVSIHRVVGSSEP